MQAIMTIPNTCIIILNLFNHGIRPRRAGTAGYPQVMVEPVRKSGYMAGDRSAGGVCSLVRMELLSAQSSDAGRAIERRAAKGGGRKLQCDSATRRRRHGIALFRLGLCADERFV